MSRKPYATDVSDEEWSFAAPYLTLMQHTAPQRPHSLREVFDALRWIVRAGAPWRLLQNDFPPWEAVYQQSRRWLEAGCFEAMVLDLRSMLRVALGRPGQPSAMVLDGRTLQSSCESGARAGYDGYKRKKGSKVHVAVDTLGQLLAVHVTPADEQERAQVGVLCEAVQQATGQTVKLAWADQGYTGEQPRQEAPSARHRLAGGQAARGQEGLRAVAAALGRRAQLCLGSALSPARARLRAPARRAAQPSLPRLRRAHAAQGRAAADRRGKFMTRSRPFIELVLQES